MRAWGVGTLVLALTGCVAPGEPMVAPPTASTPRPAVSPRTDSTMSFVRASIRVIFATWLIGVGVP